MKYSAQLPAIIFATCAITACGNSAPEPASEAKAEIGASLTEKSEVAISDLPEGVLQAAKAARLDLAFSEAEREVRNGVVYFDIGGMNKNGEEIELDIMQDIDGWRVVEVQRDISLLEAPAPVREALAAAAPGVVPARIIESDQTDGVVIYEFYTRSGDGAEEKYEVRYAGGDTEFLTEEWVH